LNLDGARCDGECYIGGKPIILVEESNLIQRMLRNALLEGSEVRPSEVTIDQPVQQDPIAATAEIPRNQPANDPPAQGVPNSDSAADKPSESISAESVVVPSRTPSLVLDEQDPKTDVVVQNIGVQANFELIGIVFLGLGLTIGLLLLVKIIRK
jgi:hypothetical protein